MSATRYNERSWAIDVIAEIKRISAGRRRAIRGAGGEKTLDAGDGSLFPDVLLYGDPSGATILQGWELKMPDTAVTDGELLSKSENKARLLGLDSFLVANGKQAVLHTLDENDQFSPEESWVVIAGDISRADVERREAEWKTSIERIIDDLNDFFDRGEISGRSLNETLSDAQLITVALESAPALAGLLEDAAAADAEFRARTNLWWDTVHQQFPGTSNPWLPLARLVLLLWVNRLTFAHLLTTWCTDASLVEDIGATVDAEEALEIFDRISDSCDFVNILSESLGARQVDDPSWSLLVQLNAFLSDLELDDVSQGLFQAVLNALSDTARRKAAGQFATPYPLASLLARLVLSDRRATFLDAFCGTGTIPKASLEAKRGAGISQQDAIESIWASDKFDIPVQITTLALTQPDAIGLPIRVFSADVVDLEPERVVQFADPETGDPIREELPTFECTASNLPFVQFEDLEDVNPEVPSINRFIAEAVGEEYQLPSKSDLYAYLPFYLWRLVQPEGRVGLILSNAWLGTDFGRSFRATLSQFYQIEHVVTSGAGRWFKESDVVGTLVILRRRSEPGTTDPDEETQFVVVEQPIEELANTERCEEIEDRIRMAREGDELTLNSLRRGDLSFCEDAGLQWGAFFGDVGWLADVRGLITQASNLFSIARGERRGWNAMFYPEEGHGIEDPYIRPVLRSPTSVDSLLAEPDGEAFCCSATLEELRNRGHTGARAWIRRFEEETNNTGRPLPEVLNQRSGFWYEMDDSTVADIVGLVNPGSRLFFPRMRERGFVDQRLVRFTDDSNSDMDLRHALLNSVLSLYYLEAIGFGRGLGALDLNATKMKKRLYMFDPRHLDEDRRDEIVEAFAPLLDRDVLPIREELEQEDRRRFDRVVFTAYEVEETLPRVREALLTLYRIRMAAIQ